jgi:hypothetical protein
MTAITANSMAKAKRSHLADVRTDPIGAIVFLSRLRGNDMDKI